MTNGDEERNLLKRALGATGACPSIEALGRYADGSMEPTARPSVESHIAACAHCRTELALFKEFRSETLLPPEERPVEWITAKLRNRAPEIFDPLPARPERVPWWKSLIAGSAFPRAAVALGSLLLVVSGVLYVRQNSAPALHPAIDSGPEIVRSNSIALISPIGDVSRRPSALEWRALQGAANYEVHLMEVDHSELWATRVSGTQVALPPEVQAKELPEKSLLWTVSAFDSSGRRIGESSPEKFRLAPVRTSP